MEKRLRLNPNHPRLHPDAQEVAMAEFLANVVWVGPALLRESSKRLIDGHLRKELANKLEKVPVVLVPGTRSRNIRKFKVRHKKKKVK
jgi:hypothetical protein